MLTLPKGNILPFCEPVLRVVSGAISACEVDKCSILDHCGDILIQFSSIITLILVIVLPIISAIINRQIPVPFWFSS